GRKRRCGWFDATQVRQSCRVGGVDGLVLTKLDVLDGFTELKIATSYRINGKSFDYYPAGEGPQAAAEPVYEVMPGWQESTRGIREFNKLPEAAKAYVRRIETLVETPLALLSTSPEREDTIIMRDPFA
ncbi:MAG TPA: adenylosuccinate synthetase, partial [Alphaproteobacteria bacterium]|nr:adenylosuccinate synthetase [Alphaproteobacteria bacterium]